MTIVTAALLLFAVTAAAVSTDASATPFDLLEDGSVIVPVTIGGTEGYRFVLDTGSSRTIISSRLWQRLRLPVVAKTLVVTPAGRDEAYVVRLGALAIDGRRAVDVTAAVMLRDRYAAGQQVDGLLGQDLLAGLVYTIDYDARTIVWHRPGEWLRGRRLLLDIRDNRVLVNLPQHDGDSSPLRLVPDSGSDALILFAHAQAKLRTTAAEIGVLSSLSGLRHVRRVEIEGLMIGSARVRIPLAVILNSDEPVEMMGDGVLPLNGFSRVTFNVAERYLIVETP